MNGSLIDEDAMNGVWAVKLGGSLLNGPALRPSLVALAEREAAWPDASFS